MCRSGEFVKLAIRNQLSQLLQIVRQLFEKDRCEITKQSNVALNPGEHRLPPIPIRERLQGQTQLLEADRFEQDFINSCLVRLLIFDNGGGRRDGNERNSPATCFSLQLADLPGEIQTIDLRHVPIEEHEIKFLSFIVIDGGFAIGGKDDFVPQHLQKVGQQPPIHRVILGN
jgi:hypothetical protein